jgi:hypothetical protein
MNADGSRPVSLRAAVAATVPALQWVAGALLTAGVVGLGLAVTLIIVPVRRAAAPAAPAGDGLPAPESGGHQ